MRKFGLIGFPLTHSFSKKYFEGKFKQEEITDCSYDLFPFYPIDQLLPLITAKPDLAGLNVTIPYKSAVMPYLTEVDALAGKIGAVNCIKITNGQLKGYNTDVTGFEKSLTSFLTSKPAQVFVLGTGGSAKSVRFVLKGMGFDFINVSRDPDDNSISYPQISTKMKSANLFINTTPLGMYPNTEFAPEIPYNKLTEKDYLFDLVYNPEETLFLKKGKASGAKTKNGLEMLQIQAEESWAVWNKAD